MAHNASNGEKDRLIQLLSNALNKSLDFSLNRGKRLFYFSFGFLTGLGLALPFLISLNAERSRLLSYPYSYNTIQQMNELKTEIQQLSLLVDEKNTVDRDLNDSASDAGNTPTLAPPEKRTTLDPKFEVFIHYKRDDYKELLEELWEQLGEAANLNVHGMERVNLNFRKNEIRYFREADRRGAKEVLSLIHSFFHARNKEGNIPIFDVRSFSEDFPNARKGLVEVWVNSLKSLADPVK